MAQDGEVTKLSRGKYQHPDRAIRMTTLILKKTASHYGGDWPDERGSRRVERSGRVDSGENQLSKSRKHASRFCYYRHAKSSNHSASKDDHPSLLRKLRRADVARFHRA
jgi:hypothetical protein